MTWSSSGHSAFAVLLGALSLLTGIVQTAEAQTCGSEPLERPLWGDLHVHTSFSMDAYVVGARRMPGDAYAFARGAPDLLPSGGEVRIDRPLDFMAVTDHAEYLGVPHYCLNAGAESEYCATLDTASQKGDISAFRKFFLPGLMGNKPICPMNEDIHSSSSACETSRLSAWQEIQRAAETANAPCEFTTFVGYEWSASPNVLHLHRNIIFEATEVTEVPIDSVNQVTQEALWQALDERCDPADGCQALAIPHNSNIGMGGTFRVDPSDIASLQIRARYERLAEVFQHKGQSECYPGALLADEACAFEIMLPVPVSQRLLSSPSRITGEEQSGIEAGYLRHALGQGLAIGAETGVNPFRYGMIGSTDTHSVRPGYVTEKEWAGAFGNTDDTIAKQLVNPHYNPGGLVAVWAEENSRTSIFAALSDRAAYGTSGPRITLRFDQTFDDGLDLCGASADLVTSMGGTLDEGMDGSARFAVRVLKDVHPIARIDIVKIFYRDGTVQQSLATAESEGRADWCRIWTDPDYRPGEPALWYARVLEVPTPRWNSVVEGKEVLVQERAWSSPIWSLPE